jgi:hypothetical protein
LQAASQSQVSRAEISSCFSMVDFLFSLANVDFPVTY